MGVIATERKENKIEWNWKNHRKTIQNQNAHECVVSLIVERNI